MMDTAVDPAERKERNSLHHSLGTEWSELPKLPKRPARNSFSKALVSLGIKSRAEKIALMESMVQERRHSRNSRTPESIASSRVPCLTVILNNSLTECRLIVSTVPGTDADTWDLVEKE
jgi:hypothetical protein